MKPAPVDDLIEMLSYRGPHLKACILSPTSETPKFYSLLRPSISASLYAYNGDSGDFTTVNLDPLFSGVNWPDLENIHLCGVHLSPSVFSRFLAAYPFIRSFSVVEATDSSRLIKSDGFNFFEPKTPDRLSLLIGILPNVTTFARQTI
jgi:hypothetical protein